MSDLVEFLRARIAEDEAAGRAKKAEWGGQWQTGDSPRVIGSFDPNRVLAECKAKRRIVEQLERHERLVAANLKKQTEASRGGIANQEQISALRSHGWELHGRLEALRMAIGSLAAVYAAHPDYDEAWRP